MSELDRLRKNVFENLNEIERLNNIIKELEERNNKAIKLLENDINFPELCDGQEVINLLRGDK